MMLAWSFPSATKLKLLMQCTRKLYHTHNNAIPKQRVCERGEDQLKYVKCASKVAKRTLKWPANGYI